MLLQMQALQVPILLLILPWQDLSSGKVLGIGKAEGGLYYLRSEASYKSAAFTTSINNARNVSVMIWHSRLGHISLERLKDFDESVLFVLYPNNVAYHFLLAPLVLSC